MVMQKNATGTAKKLWQLRVWHGMTMSAWFRLLWGNRFRVPPARWFTVAVVTLASVLNSALALAQRMLFGRRIRRTVLRDDPIFVLGHWRSGTTLLHELLALDERHSFPTTYACLAPSHFLVSRGLLGWLRFFVPQRRSQDNVRLDFDKPQEDEWALCALGLPTPYQAIAFPNRLSRAGRVVGFAGATPREVDRWKRSWVRFLKSVSLRWPNRLVIKSPLHTTRIDVLLDIFPNARFVHVVRDPTSVYPSTVRLWSRLAEDEGLQAPQWDGLEEFVLANFKRVHESFARNRHRIPADRLCEIRYEDLVADPLRQVRLIYQQLQLGGFANVRPALASYLAEMKDFATNQYELSREERARISHRWGPWFQRLGYRPPVSEDNRVSRAMRSANTAGE